MKNTHSKTIRFVVLLTTLVCLIGCGQSSKSKEAKRAAVVAPVVIAVASPPQTPARKPRSAIQPSEISANGSGRKPHPIGTDPRTVFEVQSVAVPVEVDVTPGFQSDDVFVVQSGTVGLDSTQMIVTSTGQVPEPGSPRPGFALPKGFVPFVEAGYSIDGLPLRIQCEKTGTSMALVPAGLVRMGTNQGPTESQPLSTLKCFDKSSEKKRSLPLPRRIPRPLPKCPFSVFLGESLKPMRVGWGWSYRRRLSLRRLRVVRTVCGPLGVTVALCGLSSEPPKQCN